MHLEEKRTLPTAMLLILLLSAAAGGAEKGPSPPATEDITLPGSDLPNLFARTRRAEVAVLGQVDGPAHYAHFRVEEVYRGDYERETLDIIYRGESWGRRVAGQDPIKFVDGDRYLLFLNYYRERGKVVRPDLFVLTDGDWGRVRLSGENEPLHVEAMRLLLGATLVPDSEQRQAVLLALMANSNHLAAGAAMHQVAEQGLGSADEIPLLLKQLQRGHAALKASALRILRRMGPTLPSTFDRSSVAEAIHLRVGWDGSDPEDVRLAAVKALASLGDEALPFLQQAADADVNQNVRYEAAVAVFELESGG